MTTRNTSEPPSTRQRKWLDASLPIEQRVELLLAQMTLAEKVGQLHQLTNLDPTDPEDLALIRSGGISSTLFASGPHAGNERDAGSFRAALATLQRTAVEESRLGIPLLFARDVIHGHRTIFPIPLGLAASFDPEQAEVAGATLAQEARRDGIQWTFAPMLDISEDARWGRVAESLGEAPKLAQEMARALVRGIQGSPVPHTGTIDPRRTLACMKHFAGYGMAMGGRDYDSVYAGENTMRNIHLRPFHAALEEGVATAMASFNDLDGIPMHANEHYVRGILKEEWGFDGFVVADYNAVGELINHGVAADRREAAREAILAGIDMDMLSGCYRDHLEELVTSGEVPSEIVDDSVRRVLRAKFRAGLFEENCKSESRPSRVDQWAGPIPETDLEAAEEAAISASVLLKNNGSLPLDAASDIYVAGPFARERYSLMGTWVLDGHEADVGTIEDALREAFTGKVEVDDGNFSDLAGRRSKPGNPAIVLLGEHSRRSGEANSVASVELPEGQLDLLRAVARTGRPTIAVIFTGRPLALTEVSHIADAVLVVFHSGTSAARALAKILTGEREPRGRLPMTFPRSTGQLPLSINERRTSRPLYCYPDFNWRYLDLENGPLYPFGAGMGYGAVAIEAVSTDVTEVSIGAHSSITLTVTLTNSGDAPTEALAQLYLSDPAAQVTRPKKEYVASRWVSLGATGTAQASFIFTAEQAGYFGRDNRWRIDEGALSLGVGLDSANVEWVSIKVVA